MFQSPGTFISVAGASKSFLSRRNRCAYLRKSRYLDSGDDRSLADGSRKSNAVRSLLLSTRAVQPRGFTSDTKSDFLETTSLCREVEVLEAKSVYGKEPVQVRVFRAFNIDLLEPLGVLSWDEVTEDVQSEYPMTYENHEIVYFESGSFQLHVPEWETPLVLRAGDMAEFADGVYGSGRVIEQLRRRFIFCSPEQWEASLKRALSEAALKEHERPSDFSAASDTTQQVSTSAAAHVVDREPYEPISSGSSEERFAGTKATPALGAPASVEPQQPRLDMQPERKRGGAARARMDSELAFPNWVAYALGDLIQIGAAMTLILFWDTGPGTIIPSREINFVLHYILVPLGTTGACLSALARISIELVPSLRKHPLARLVPRYEDIDDPRQRHLRKND